MLHEIYEICMPKRKLFSMKTKTNILEGLDKNESLKMFLEKCGQEKDEQFGGGMAIVQI